MKICAVVCEYNPFHNGHARQLAEIGEKSGCDRILCLMSGNFTQRGEAAVYGKYTRARHAVLGGADAVVELPAAFATGAAEVFAGGAVRLLASVPAVSALAFGCECGDKQSFLAAARALGREDKNFKAALKEAMKDGSSYAKARTETVLQLNRDVDESLLTSPNNILGTEYCRAILATGAAIEPLPLLRTGCGYADTELACNFSSARALRAALGDGSHKTRKALKSNLPAFALADALAYRPVPFGQAALSALLRAPEEEVAATPDCAEGLENRLRAMARSNPDYDGMLEKVVTKRYPLSRLKRILVQNYLAVTKKDVLSYLSAPLYLKTLAVRADRAEEMLAALGESSFPLIVRKSDYSLLKKEALACFGTDVRANDLYNVLAGVRTNEYETLFVPVE